MTFYLRPPQGTASLTVLEECSMRRLKFLLRIADFEGDFLTTKEFIDEAHTVEEFGSYLLEGSRNDRIGHFFLRLVAAQDHSMRRFFVNMETKLFLFRFNCMTKDEIHSFLRSLRNDIRKLRPPTQSYPAMARILNVIYESLKFKSNWREIVEHYLSGDETPCIRIGFTYALDLVRRRWVEMEDGVACVPCDRLAFLLVELFGQVLEVGMKIASQVAPEQMKDRRYRIIAERCKKLYRQSEHRPSPMTSPFQLSHDRIDHAVTSFPACMAALHERLRRNHRLPHHDRVQYTLFLKEVGLPIHEALKFWRAEYVQTPAPHCTYGSDWLTSEQRYTYNIRHLYGLEGSKVNYRGHGCSKIQERGLCPYASSTRSEMLRRPCNACHSNLLAKVEKISVPMEKAETIAVIPLKDSAEDRLSIRTPIDFFFSYQKLLQSLQSADNS